jgi:hypothetical protein
VSGLYEAVKPAEAGLADQSVQKAPSTTSKATKEFRMACLLKNAPGQSRH